MHLPLGQTLQKPLGQLTGRPVVKRQREIALRLLRSPQRLRKQRQRRKHYEPNRAETAEQYKEYYESIDPDNAELLYKQVVEQQQTDSKISDYVKGYSQMKPKEAAAIFDTMTDNLNLVAQILENMDAQSRADILGKMNSDTAAKVTEIMNPSE